jgi:hypothetical protein
VEFLWSLPKQEKEELVMSVNMYPTEWNLPKQDKEELMVLFGMSAAEWEKGAREEKEGPAEAEQARPGRIVSSTGQSGQARSGAWSFGTLAAALTWLAGSCLALL